MNETIAKLSFEDSMKRLEEIVNNLENGNVELENAIELYTEGTKLQEHCEDKLSHAKLKIEKIVKNNKNLDIKKVDI